MIMPTIVLNSTEYEICPSTKSQIINKCQFFLAQRSMSISLLINRKMPTIALNSAEYKMCPSNKSQIINKCQFFLAQRSMSISLLINRKMPTIVLYSAGYEICPADKSQIAKHSWAWNFLSIIKFGIFIFISSEKFMLSWGGHENGFMTSWPGVPFLPS